MKSTHRNVNADDHESMFGNLPDDGRNRKASGAEGFESGERSRVRARGAPYGKEADKPFPVIRKPVSVKQSGALRPPKPGDPVEPPPPLTEFRQTREIRIPAKIQSEPDFDGLDRALNDDDWPLSEEWVDARRGHAPVYYDEPSSGELRKWGIAAALLLIIGGVTLVLHDREPVRGWLDSAYAKLTGFVNQQNIASGEQADVLRDANRTTTSGLQENPTDPEANTAALTVDPNSLYNRFKEELARLEDLVNQGELAEATARLDNMDRAVFGYGSPEFTEISERIATIRAGEEIAIESSQDTASTEGEPEAERLAQQQAEEERAAAEAERLAQQQADEERAAAEAERLAQQQAEEERAAAEAERLAQQQAEEERAAAEAERLAQQQADEERARAEAERLERQEIEQERAAVLAEQLAQRQAEEQRAAAEDEQAAQLRADRLAQDRARQEQLDEAAAERAAALQQQEQRPDIDESALTVQELAARQREDARQQRLSVAQPSTQQADDDNTSSASPVESESSASQSDDVTVALAESASEPLPRQADQRPISDSDLQQVYRQFVGLKDAIQERDINSVIELTSRSGLRVQQVLQMFENNVSISAQLRNVSTLDAAGEIRGILQITRLERADGMVTGPPQEFESVLISAVRQGDGWSSIRW